MEWALRWVFPDVGTTIVTFGGLFLLATYILDKFNHHDLPTKFLNTAKFGIGFGLTTLAGVYLEYLHEVIEPLRIGLPGQADRIWLPIFLIGGMGATVILADWFTMIPFKLGYGISTEVDYATHKIWTAIVSGGAFLRKRAAALMSSLWGLLVVILLMGCSADSTLMATINASNTQIASTHLPSPSPDATPSITTTPTSSIEVSTQATSTAPSIVEVGTPVNDPPQPLYVYPRDGIYIPERAWNVRAIPGGPVIDSMSPGKEYRIYGWTFDIDGTAWLCSKPIKPDEHGAVLCEGAVMFKDSSHQKYGTVIWSDGE